MTNWVFNCNKCRLPIVFELLTGFETGEEHGVFRCNKCKNAGVKAKIEAMSDKTVVRCSQCGAWKIEKRSCYTPTCSKTNVQSVLATTQTL